jgi:hypothetical protein
MPHRCRRIAFALAVGLLLTIVTAAVAAALSSESVRELIFWPNTVLQSLVPAPNIGTSHHSVYEGTPLNFAAFVASFPFAVVVYGSLAYAVLRYLKT